MSAQVKGGGDLTQSLRDQIKKRVMELEYVIIFTEYPPDGEENFTICAEKSILDLPEHVRGDRPLSQDERKATHTMTHDIGKGETLISQSSVFTRVQKGKRRKTCKILTFYLLYLIVNF